MYVVLDCEEPGRLAVVWTRGDDMESSLLEARDPEAGCLEACAVLGLDPQTAEVEYLGEV